MDAIQKFIKGDYPGDEQELLRKALDMLEVMRSSVLHAMDKCITQPERSDKVNRILAAALQKCEQIAGGE